MKKKLLVVAYAFLCGVSPSVQASTAPNFSEEIEIKIKLDDQQSDLLCSWLAKNAQSSVAVEMVDTYFQHPSILAPFRNAQGFDDADLFLRVRTQPNGFSVCCKNSGDQLERRIEAETGVTSGREMMNILLLLGFYKHVEVRKNRIKHKIQFQNSILEVALDQKVQGAVAGGDLVDFGNFTEIEIKDGSKDINVLYNFLHHVGISEFKLFTKSYYHIALNPAHNFYEMRSLYNNDRGAAVATVTHDHELVKTCHELCDQGLTTEQVVDFVVKSDNKNAYSRWLAELENDEDFDREQSTILCPCSVEMLTVAAVLLAYGVHVIYCWDWDF
ncbi:CYTH domain-containing protein [bacterium]|nr:MAG: CYTH domain-containing protein [bacterium]